MTAKRPAPAGARPTKYDEPGRAERYAARSTARHEEEMALLDRLLARIPAPSDVLDVPCGTGRVAAALLARGWRVRGADLSPSMRAAARRALGTTAGFLGVEPIDLRAPLAGGGDLRADLVVCFRFFHHLPDAAARRQVLRTLAGLARRHVLLSFFHPVSAHAAARAVRRVATGRKGDRHAVTLSRLTAEAREAGLVPVASDSLGRYRRDLWAVVFEV